MIHMGDGFYFDMEMQEIVKKGNVILSLRGLKGVILEVLLKNGKDSYLSKEKLIELTWGKSALIVGISSLTQQIYLLRKSLNQIGLHNYILSRTKSGYKIAKKLNHLTHEKTSSYMNDNNPFFYEDITQ